jgi:hypothetical protein
MPGPMILPDGPELMRRVLNRQRIGTYRVVSRYVLENAELELVENEVGNLVFQLISEVLTEHITGDSKTVRLDVPASWWQNFKETYKDFWGFRLFVKRYPPKMETLENTVTFDRYARYPNADVPVQPLAGLGRPIFVESINQTGWVVNG